MSHDMSRRTPALIGRGVGQKYLFVCRNFTRIVKVKPGELMRALNEINPERIEILA